MTSEWRGRRLSMAIPSSLVSETSHPREKTGILGRVARAAAIYRVDDIHIYRDTQDESKLIRTVLSYAETPQYLRRRLFDIRPELRYAGILPPLRTPHHPLEDRADKLTKGEHREGVVLSEESGFFLVDIGVERPLKAWGRAPSIGSRATIRIESTTPELIGKFVGRKEIGQYWGYGVHVTDNGLGTLVRGWGFDLTIATSRYGTPFRKVEHQLSARWKEARSTLVAFGSPRNGVGELLSREKLTIQEAFHFSVNMIPGQGCETVRTEEAIHASLAILNLLDG
jgi:predicted SPOUT superfamily RNA methylase MTH1